MFRAELPACGVIVDSYRLQDVDVLLLDLAWKPDRDKRQHVTPARRPPMVAVWCPGRYLAQPDDVCACLEYGLSLADLPGHRFSQARRSARGDELEIRGETMLHRIRILHYSAYSRAQTLRKAKLLISKSA
jgi:hypothetical protein